MRLEIPNTDHVATAYELVETPEPALARVRFTGVFQSRNLTWEARILTLQHAYEQYINCNRVASESPIVMQSYIEVFGPETYQAQRSIEIALNTSEVQHATILKTIIMVRQYKHLRLGRHSFGAKIQFPENRDLDIA